MKKSTFIAMLLGTVSGIFLALGMCMILIPDWEAFQPGILLGIIGLFLGLITLITWRKMERKPPLKISAKFLCSAFLGILGTLAFGLGMCFTMVWNQIVSGIIIGFAGIIILLCLIPLTKGIKK